MTPDPLGAAPQRSWGWVQALALLRALAVATLLAKGSAVAWAQVSLQSVSSSVQGGVEVVRIEFSQPLNRQPAGFAVQTPPRIALDFAGVSNALSSGLVAVNQGNLRTVTVAEAGERTRVVLNLVRPSAYQTQIDGKALLVRLEAADAPAAAAAVPAAAVRATAGALSSPALREIDFRRSAEGTGRIIVTLPSPDTVVDIRNQGQNLALEFLRVSLPENLRRRLDVTDFGTPVQAVSTVQNGDRVFSPPASASPTPPELEPLDLK